MRVNGLNQLYKPVGTPVADAQLSTTWPSVWVNGHGTAEASTWTVSSRTKSSKARSTAWSAIHSAFRRTARSQHATRTTSRTSCGWTGGTRGAHVMGTGAHRPPCCAKCAGLGSGRVPRGGTFTRLRLSRARARRAATRQQKWNTPTTTRTLAQSSSSFSTRASSSGASPVVSRWFF